MREKCTKNHEEHVHEKISKVIRYDYAKSEIVWVNNIFKNAKKKKYGIVAATMSANKMCNKYVYLISVTFILFTVKNYMHWNKKGILFTKQRLKNK